MFFHFLKKKQNNIVFERSNNMSSSDKKIAFFNNEGILYDVYPRDNSKTLEENRSVAYSADVFVVDNKTYDLHDPESIAQIPTPNWNNSSDTFLNVTIYLDYILRVRLGNGNDTPATTAAIARKASSLMETSPIMYNPENSFKITNQLMKVGLFDEADIEFQKILNSFFSSRQDWTRRMQDVILKNPLVVASNHVGTCPFCSIYRNRVYSTDGKDKRFPKLPKDFFTYGAFHPGCTHVFYPFIYRRGCFLEEYFVDESTGNVITQKYDAIKYSNRPFVPEEKFIRMRDNLNPDGTPAIDVAYEKLVNDYSNSKTHYENRWEKLKEYELVKKVLPKIAPSSYAGYSRMKSMQTKNFLKIVEEMQKLGYDIK